MADFVSGFWNVYIIVLTLLGLLFCVFVLMSNLTERKSGPAELHGHVWDEDLAEYNNPLPRWFFYLFWITLIFGLGYLALYPGLGSYQGMLGWSSTERYESEMTEADERFGPLFAQYAEMDVMQVAANPDAIETGERLFQNYCAQCHGSDARGSRGFPNLTDGAWLWGGDPEHIRTSIANGRTGVMPALGAAIGSEGVRNVTHYLRSLNGLVHDSVRAFHGNEIYTRHCAACHGQEAEGMALMGAPRLNDNAWLWGSSEAAITETIMQGRHNRMPGFGEFLGEDKVHVLTAYVWSLTNPSNGAETED